MADPTEIVENVPRSAITEPSWRADPRILIGPSLPNDKSIRNFAVYDDQFFIMLVENINLPPEPDLPVGHDVTKDTDSPTESDSKILHLEPDLPKENYSPTEFKSMLLHVGCDLLPELDLPDEHDLIKKRDSHNESHTMMLKPDPDVIKELDVSKKPHSDTESHPMITLHLEPSSWENPQSSSQNDPVCSLDLKSYLPNKPDTPDETGSTKKPDSPEKSHSMVIWQAETGYTWVLQIPDAIPEDFSFSEKYLVIKTEDRRYFVFVFDDNPAISLNCQDYLSVHHQLHPFWTLATDCNNHAPQDKTHQCDFLRFVGELVDQPVERLSSWHLRSPYMFATSYEGPKSSIHKWDLSTCNYVGAHTDFDGHSVVGYFDDEFIIRIVIGKSCREAEIFKVDSIRHKFPFSIPKREGLYRNFYRYLYLDRSENVLLLFAIGGLITMIDNFDKYAKSEDPDKYVHHLNLFTGGASIGIEYVAIKNRRVVMCIQNSIPKVDPDGEHPIVNMIVMFTLRNSSDREDPSKLPQIEILSVFSLPNRPLKMGDKHVYLAGDINKYKDIDWDILCRCKLIAEANIIESWSTNLYWENCQGNPVCYAFQHPETAVHDLDSVVLKEVSEFFRTWTPDEKPRPNAIFTIDIPHQVNEFISGCSIDPDWKVHKDVEFGVN